MVHLKKKSLQYLTEVTVSHKTCTVINLRTSIVGVYRHYGLKYLLFCLLVPDVYTHLVLLSKLYTYIEIIKYNVYNFIYEPVEIILFLDKSWTD